MDTCFNN